MTSTSESQWKKHTDETRAVERILRDAGFTDVEAYRYNAASIRVRVIDPRFDGLPPEKRDALVEPVLAKLPEPTQADIISLFTFAPAELQQTPHTLRQFLLNIEFDDPSPSML